MAIPKDENNFSGIFTSQTALLPPKTLGWRAPAVDQGSAVTDTSNTTYDAGTGYASYASSGGSGGSSASTKSSDAEQVRILRELLEGGFEEAREQRLANIQRVYEQGDSALLQSYDARAESLETLREDTKKSEADTSFANLGNRARESSDILSEIATQGAGETDALRTQLIAARRFHPRLAWRSR